MVSTCHITNDEVATTRPPALTADGRPPQTPRSAPPSTGWLLPLARALMRHSRLLTGRAPALAVVVAAFVAGALCGGFTDLFVYRYGGRALLDGLPAYESGDPVTGLHFTYPPLAAVVMVPLALLPAWLAAALWTGASVGALAAVVVLVRRALGRPAPRRSPPTSTRGNWPTP